MFLGECLPCCGCPCRADLFEKLRASSVSLSLTSSVPNQIALTAGPYKVYGGVAMPGVEPPNPNLSPFTFYQASDFYKTYDLALDTRLTGYVCIRRYQGLYNTSNVGFSYLDDNIDVSVVMQIAPQQSDGAAPKFAGSTMQKIGSTQCYFGARFYATLYDKSTSITAGQLPSGFSLDKTARNSPLFNSTPPYTQKVWTVQPSPTATCGGDDFFGYPTLGFWDQNYATSDVSFARSMYATLSDPSESVTIASVMTQATISNELPIAATCVAPMTRLLPTRFWTTDATKQYPCNGRFNTSTILGNDSSPSSASGVIHITPPQ